MPKLKDLLFGGKDKIKQVSTQTPDQQQLMQLILEGLTSGEGPLGELFSFNPEEFDKGVTQPALKNFQENILPQLQEKYIAGNQSLGSGMRNAELKAGTDLQSKLAELMYQAKQGQQQNKLSGINQVLGNKGFENVYKQGKTGVLPSFLQGAGQGIGQSFGQGIAGSNAVVVG